ncbi:MAG: hypothetical protein ACT4PE_09950 [Candidatus Eiseniibacteriota bacterium]
MTRKNLNETVKALANEELAKVVGGTGTPEQPIGDPAETGEAFGEMAWQAFSKPGR